MGGIAAIIGAFMIKGQAEKQPELRSRESIFFQ
jgi:hypothetical protein